MQITANDPVILVVEIGGTSLRAGIFDSEHATILEFVRRATPQRLEPVEPAEPRSSIDPSLAAALRELTHNICGDREPDVVAVAYPAPIDANGNALAAPTLAGDRRTRALPQALSRVWPRTRIHILNDLTAAGIRYVAAGARDFCIITFGSGIGHKVFAGGRPLLGPAGRGGEIGHLRVDTRADAVRCDCGATGHVGGISSGRGSVRMMRRAAELDPVAFAASSLAEQGIDNESVAAAFAAGDPWVTNVLAEVAGYAATALAAIHLCTGVERFILVGGWTHALGERYRELLVHSAQTACWDLGQSWNEMLTIGEPDDQDALIGAGLYAVLEGAAT